MTGTANKNGTYIPKNRLDLARALAQKDYDEKVLCAAQAEMTALRQTVDRYPEVLPEDIYLTLSPERRSLVNPIRLTDEELIERWLAKPFEPKEFRDGMPEFYSNRGERVRSKSEKIIADTLLKMNIPYKYECPLYLKGFGTVHPDFTILHVRKRKVKYLEHLGRMDDPNYNEVNMERIHYYEQNGIWPGEDLILTHETRMHPLNTRTLEELLAHYFL